MSEAEYKRRMKLMAVGFVGFLVSVFLLLHFDLMNTTIGNILFITITLPFTLLTSWHAGLLMFPDRD